MKINIDNYNKFLLDLDLNNIETPNIIDEVIDEYEPTKSFIYMIWNFGNKNTSHIHFYIDNEITLMKCDIHNNKGKTLKKYNFSEIKEFLELK